ncbi:MAG TPA: alpha/beta hydrolase [Solirubrobacteraceae bacterium]|nr:alpha/beta hydrolase [Solirubrobacteraceae bacterium]
MPRHYANPRGATLRLPVARLPARRRAGRFGALFVNFGGPGEPAAESLRAIGASAFTALNARYDIVGVDPRGTGGTGAIDCRSNPETSGPIAQPFPRPATLQAQALIANHRSYVSRCLRLNRRILPYVTTANSARDMDRVRRALGLTAISFLGFSYGTLLGATYESLFPAHVGRFVLDGAVDPATYLNRPIQSQREQTRAFETALGRFFQACAAHQGACERFGADDPWAAFDRLAASMNAAPLPARGRDPRPADGDDLLAAASIGLFAKQLWPFLARALAQAVDGDGTGVRRLADEFYRRNPDGTYDPLNDRFFAITSLEARAPTGIGLYLDVAADDFELFPHFWWNSGYSVLAWSQWPVRPRGAYYGPFSAPASALPTLVVGTTYDPATPYADAPRLAATLGNARLLTMRGDGHTAYLGGNSGCIDRAVERYLIAGVVPPAGTVCAQDVPFRRLPGRASLATVARSVRLLDMGRRAALRGPA